LLELVPDLYFQTKFWNYGRYKDKWITSTGIKERRIQRRTKEHRLAIKAAQDLIAKANIDPLEIDLLIMALHLICQWHLQALCCNQPNAWV
jgi:3-oxoacyl-[acyl-carrier-protein] synthase III